MLLGKTNKKIQTRNTVDCTSTFISEGEHDRAGTIQFVPCVLGSSSVLCGRGREGERVLHLSSHTRLMQVLPGHPLADPKRRHSMHQHKERQAYESIYSYQTYQYRDVNKDQVKESMILASPGQH